MDARAAKMRAKYAALRSETRSRNRFGKGRKLPGGHPIALYEGVFEVRSSWQALEAYLWRTLGRPPFAYHSYQKRGLVT
jgi:hypothetical protein